MNWIDYEAEWKVRVWNLMHIEIYEFLIYTFFKKEIKM